LSLRYLRPCTVDEATVIARGRILHGGLSVTTVDVLLEDALGRAVAHASASVVFAPMDPPPPPLPRPLDTVEEPTYTTPDPPLRPLPQQPPMHFAGGGLTAMPPFAEFLGVELTGLSERQATGTLPASPWFARLHPEVAPGIMGAAADLVAGPAIAQTMDTDSERLVIINSSHSFLASVPTDGRPLTITASVNEREGELFIVQSRIVDGRGRVVMIGHGPCMIRPRRVAGPRRASERVLVTVLFTDMVSSTERVQELGDAKWSELLDDYHVLDRRKLAQFRGREVKAMGDGFLFTFESPNRAVECASAIRAAVRALGLEVRVGVHTGECEVTGGDLSGVAVHVAARLQSAASPGEILVSNTVRELIQGSGISVAERGERELKGLDGSWSLFAVE
jgi:class 3 adenylate cyclase